MPWIDVEGAANMRDLGGTPTEDGGSIVPRRLLRSDNLQGLTPRDVDELVNDIGVTTIVDLRAPAEVAKEGPGPLDSVPGVRHAYHPVLPEFPSRRTRSPARSSRRSWSGTPRATRTTRRPGTTSATWRTARRR